VLERFKTLIVVFLGFVLGAGLVNIPMRLTGSSSEGTLVGVLLCAIGLTAIRPGARWIAGLSVGFGMILMSAFLLFGEVTNLREIKQGEIFEFALAVVEAIVPAFFGVILGTALVRATPRGATLGVILIVVAFGGLYYWTNRSHQALVANEEAARSKVQRLIEAQESYRLSNAELGYSCDLNELGIGFTKIVEFSPEYAASYSRATDGTFIYDLVCIVPSKPVENYILVARTPPSVRTSRYAYCADEKGVVRELDRRASTSCMPDGVIPAGKMVDVKTFIANKKTGTQN
jgi:hypothetical protein